MISNHCAALQSLSTDNQLTHTSISSTTSDDIQLIASNELNVQKMSAYDANAVAVTNRTSKVSRCFGNTLCMPQNLLCFKVRLSTNFCILVINLCHKNQIKSNYFLTPYSIDPNFTNSQTLPRKCSVEKK